MSEVDRSYSKGKLTERVRGLWSMSMGGEHAEGFGRIWILTLSHDSPHS